MSNEPPTADLGPDLAELLAYAEGRVADPAEVQAMRDRLARDARLRAHWESVRHLDLERAAAAQDAADLRTFHRVTAACRAVAAGTGEAPERHVDACVFCRRSRRAAVARAAEAELGEPLLRDRLLRPVWGPPLTAATERVRASPPATRVALVLTAGGVAALVFDGTRTDLRPAGVLLSVGGWAVPPYQRARMRSTTRGGESGQEATSLEFRRPVGDGGELAVSLQAFRGDVKWTCRLSLPPGTAARLSAGGATAATDPWGQAELAGAAVAGSFRGLRVWVGDDARVWGEFVFQPGE